MSRNPGAGHRHARLQQILHEEVDALVRDELTDPDVYGAIITGVTLSVDYKNARVLFAIEGQQHPSHEEVARRERALGRASRFLRVRLAEAIDTKFVPQLRFVFDRDAIVSRDEEPPTSDLEA